MGLGSGGSGGGLGAAAARFCGAGVHVALLPTSPADSGGAVHLAIIGHAAPGECLAVEREGKLAFSILSAPAACNSGSRS